jgi:hypothetical protein
MDEIDRIRAENLVDGLGPQKRHGGRVCENRLALTMYENRFGRCLDQRAIIGFLVFPIGRGI